MSEGLTLAFDTSAAHCAAVLVSEKGVLAERLLPISRGRSERLLPLLDAVLAEGGAGFGDVRRIGVGVGPGDFTGIRISVAAARGLSLSLGIPAHGVSTFDALAVDRAEPFMVTVDARGGRVFVQLFDGPHAPERLDATAFERFLIAHAVARVDRDDPSLPNLARGIARCAMTRAAAPGTRPTPFYLRGAGATPAPDPAPVILP
ncbi:MAG: tRNA (adenosine(37)-N6)-threonylcarbamoyltransferase complex dimerization subunit type 1 TsaB [Pseudomonadota bacterium]